MRSVCSELINFKNSGMENEMPKTEETVVTEVGGTAVVTDTVVEAGVAGTVAPKQSFVDRMSAGKNFLCKMDRTTKSFIVVFGVFALVVAGFITFKGLFIAATVNGSPISRLSVVQELEKQSGKNVLDTMITKKLIESEIKKEKVVVAPADIDAEIKKVEAQVGAQGGTLDEALAGQGMTMADLREQIMINKALEQILADKTAISDEEVNQYLSTTKMPVAKGVSSADQVNQVREQLKGKKFSTEATQWVSDLKTKAAITYYVPYGQ